VDHMAGLLFHEATSSQGKTFLLNRCGGIVDAAEYVVHVAPVAGLVLMIIRHRLYHIRDGDEMNRTVHEHACLRSRGERYEPPAVACGHWNTPLPLACLVSELQYPLSSQGCSGETMTFDPIRGQTPVGVLAELRLCLPDSFSFQRSFGIDDRNSTTAGSYGRNTYQVV